MSCKERIGGALFLTLTIILQQNRCQFALISDFLRAAAVATARAAKLPRPHSSRSTMNHVLWLTMTSFSPSSLTPSAQNIHEGMT